MKRFIIIPLALVAIGFTSCGIAPSGEDATEDPAPISAAETTVVETPVADVVKAPAPIPAPPTTAAPAPVDAPAPAPAPTPIQVNIVNERTDVTVPEGPVVVAPAPPPVVIQAPAPPPVIVQAPAPAPFDPTRIAPGVIEDGVHYGYLYDWEGWEFSFDRVDIDANGTWTNANPKLRTLPYSGSWNTSYFTSGQAIEVHVENQRVVAAYVVDEYCGC